MAQPESPGGVALEDRPPPSSGSLALASVGQRQLLPAPARPAAMSHRLVADTQLIKIAQMATVGGHRDVLLRDRPTSSGHGFDLQQVARAQSQIARAASSPTLDAPAPLPNQPGEGADPETLHQPALAPPTARSASYSIPDHHRASHSTVTAVDGVAQKLRDEPLLDCLADRETCLLCYFCPFVLVGRTARFAGFDPWLCGCMWCILPPCVGAVLRQSVALRLGEEPPHFLTSLLYNHCVCCVCSVLQEARVAKQAARPAGA
jgi:Cys-rich protein (TIGR01571 family)